MEEKVITKTTVNGETYKFKDEDAARSGELSEEIANREAADSQLGAELGQKQDTLTETQLAAVNSGIDATKVTQIDTNATSIDTIEEKIPAQASSSNQLADKNFVNSSIQTQTAHFRGNWGNWAAVPTDATLYPADDDGNHEPTSNDYMVLQDASDFPVAEGEPALAGTWRFKYSGAWATVGKNGWHPEYQVNETPLTSDQLAALNSGITQQAVEKLATVEANAEPNAIDSISVNGTAVTPDINKNVNLEITSGPTVVQTSGVSTTDVMSQNAVTKMVYSDPATRHEVRIGNSAFAGADAVSIGNVGNNGAGSRSVAIGVGAQVIIRGVAIGYYASCYTPQSGSIALGPYSQATAGGEMNIGSTNTEYGYKNSNYRLLSGVYDGQSAHDAATVGQLPAMFTNTQFNSILEAA